MKNFYLSLSFLFLATCAFSQATYTWSGANNASWATATSWTPTRNTPAANDILRFNDGTTKTITSVPTQTIGRLQVTNNTNVTLNAATTNRTLTVGNGAGDDIIIAAGSSLTIGSGTAFTIALTNSATADISGTLHINNGRSYGTNATANVTTVTSTGTIDNSGTVSSNAAAKLVFQAGSRYIHDQNGGTIPTATWTATSTNEITGITTTAPNGLNQNFGSLTWNNPGQTSEVSLNGQLTSIAGNLSIYRSDAERVILTDIDNSTYTLTVGGNLNVDNDSWFVITNGDNITATVNVNGNFSFTAASQTASTVDFHRATSSGTTLAKIIMNVTGNFIQTGGTTDLCYGTSNANNFTELRLGGNLSVTGTGKLYTSTEDGNITNAVITFNKAGTQTFNLATLTNLTYTSFAVASGTTLQLLSSLNLSSHATAAWGGKFTVNTGGTLDAGTNQILNSTGLVPGLNNAFTLNAGAKVITANNNGLENVLLGGTVSALLGSRSYNSGADYEFKGTSTGLFLTTPTLLTARDITINNPTGNVTLSQPMAVTRDLKLLDGELNTSLLTLITINDDATTTGFSDQSFITGPIMKRGNDNFTFPTGRSGAGLVPIRLTSLSASSDFVATYTRMPALTLGLITATGLMRVSYCEYWNLTRLGAATANVTMYWNSQSNCNAAGYVTDLTSIVVSRFNTVNWDGYGRTGGTSGTIANGSVTWNNVNTFNSFALGSTSLASNPLPITLANVKAFEKNNGVEVQWSNLTEKDIADYVVQHSENGADFTDIKTQLPKSNQSDKADYSSFDASPVRGVNYYRIKAREVTGHVIYSKILRVDIGSKGQSVSLYPNPVTDKQLTIALNGIKHGTYNVTILSNAGQVVYKASVLAQSTTVTQSIQLPSSIAPGMYTALINGPDHISNKTFIVR